MGYLTDYRGFMAALVLGAWAAGTVWMFIQTPHTDPALRGAYRLMSFYGVIGTVAGAVLLMRFVIKIP
ncbi:MAG TPA: hypothetical protein VF898_12755 [Chloroflexota bacterium]